ncbi:MAG: PPC domain-containing protein, partial [Coriobacteriia bacterium]|nr:PPC domain-containing protein [Coriobacteriia bacterium]
MKRTFPWLAAVLVAFTTSMFPATASAVPSVPLTTSPVTADLDEAGSAQALYHISLTAGETLVLSLSTNAGLATSDCDLDLYLYGPTSLVGNHPYAIARAVLPLYYPETIIYQVPASGVYYVEAYAAEGSGPSILTWSVVPEPLLPVYRFYNSRAGTHFYTASLDEANAVIAKWSDTFAFEGIAYYTKASRNYLQLYRFYNKQNGSHFYTVSAEERDNVISKWGYIYNYEGPTYSVSPVGEPGKTPVYRFYNKQNGSHFYTMSEAERYTVIAKWP